ncbi:hypothetical protein Forpe1208_v012403 [Fusarium oxysporum f. sp. rapae]|uniref:Uncharacterized protein n=1 Tax=Fusarium oxysporum f. sp. rapae TaxID=485398 RepID=A0A8J5NM61_FUSOX|nr:hypothetical protein Forpe1208_v012403 [Fusarium oxysporum f. sp. rapae]
MCGRSWTESRSSWRRQLQWVVGTRDCTDYNKSNGPIDEKILYPKSKPILQIATTEDELFSVVFEDSKSEFCLFFDLRLFDEPFRAGLGHISEMFVEGQMDEACSKPSPKDEHWLGDELPTNSSSVTDLSAPRRASNRFEEEPTAIFQGTNRDEIALNDELPRCRSRSEQRSRRPWPNIPINELRKLPLLFRSTTSTQGIAPDEDIRPTIATRSRIVPEEWNVLARLQDGGPFRFVHTGQRLGAPADLLPISSKAPQTYDASRALLSPSDFNSLRFAFPVDAQALTERSVRLPENFRHLFSYTVDNDQDVIDLTVDITDLTVDTGLVDRGQLALTSIRLLSVDT